MLKLQLPIDKYVYCNKTTMLVFKQLTGVAQAVKRIERYLNKI